MAKRKEHDTINALKATFASEASVPGIASGLMMELYEFITDINDSTSQTPETGHLLRPTSMHQVDFVKGLLNKAGHIQLKDKRRKQAVAKFWIKECAELTQMKDMVDRGLILKHDGILKALACADNDQLSKLVVASKNFDLTLQEWIGQKGALAIPNGDYLSDQGKDIVRSGWTAIEYIWSKGFTCDHLDKLSTYVMTGPTLKILPFFIRPKQATDSKLTLRENFADLLDNHIGPLWADPEFGELTRFMKCPDASFEHVLGHPVLASSNERLLMYRIAYYPHMTSDQLAALEAAASVDPAWAQRARNLDPAFLHILQGNFTPDAAGALQFAIIVSCHYAQRRKKADPHKEAVLGGRWVGGGSGKGLRSWCKRVNFRSTVPRPRKLMWNGQLAPNHVDAQLKHALPLLLCKRYALKVHAAFGSKLEFQL
ncbi:hypothetical protein BDA96_02G152400 [Sorghum bicolor]|uniref:Uncharacterized protein n=1 Tax=Sorghum bicolor TaxID=4558 RepID=A0A921RPR3_SORBI|nr:hypothetical protein BDA96_02G152400 [Sorghum bicolor]